MYNLKPGALKKGRGGQEEREGNKRADGWQVWWGFGDSRVETLAQSSRVGEAGPSMKALGPEEGGAGHNGKVAPTQV